jgi:adenylate cyclase
VTARILVVDDEPDLEDLVVQKFRRQIRDGVLSFVFAHDGLEALAVLEADSKVDMVVSDINMPRMDGLSLLQKLQESSGQLSTIIVSAYGDMANIRTAMNRGAFDFLTKPIDFLDSAAKSPRCSPT